MRYLIFYQSADSNIKCMIAIVSKNRCSLSDCKILALYSLQLTKIRKRRRMGETAWPYLIQLIAAILLLAHYLRDLL
jgi:hypothetical protein